MHTSTPSMVGKTNKNLVMNEVRRRGVASVDELVRRTGKSQPTVLKWLSALEDEGLLRRKGLGESTGGRPPTLYEFDRSAGYFLGVEMEIPWVRLALLDLTGQPTTLAATALETGSHPRDVLDDLLTQLERFLESAERPPILGVGVGISGFVDVRSGTSLATPRLQDWSNVPIGDRFSEALGLPVVVNQHIDALTLAELSYGVARFWPDFLLFDVGYGLGVRAVRDGRPFSGLLGNAGLIGHTTVVPDGRPCLCGNNGCLEEYVSGRVLLRERAQEEAPEHEDAIDHAARRLFERAEANEADAKDLIGKFDQFLAIGIANVVNIFEQPRVVLSGFPVHGGEGFLASLTGNVRSRLQSAVSEGLEIRFAQVPRPRAGAQGSALFALRKHLPFADPLVVHQPEERRPKPQKEEVASAH